MVLDMSGYCEKDEKCTNSLRVYRTARGVPGEDVELLWDTDFPSGAKLEVWGKRILAVSYKKDLVEIREIEPPKKK